MSPAYRKKEEDPQRDIKILNKVIEDKDFKPVHLLCGEEDYLRLQFRDSLCRAMGAVKGSLAFDRFIGPDTRPERIIDLAETLPFMAERRVILIEDTDWFKNGCSVIEEYIDQGVPETTSLVFCEKNTDKRVKLYKTVDKNGLISVFPTQTDATLAAWISGRLRAMGTVVSAADASYMVSVVGNDMLTLANETDKLSAYCMDKGTAGKADIDAVCTRKLEDRVFDMCEAIAFRDQRRALTMYYDLVALKEAPVKILVLITRQFETLLKIKDLSERRYGNAVIAGKVGRPAWTIDNYLKQAKNYKLPELKSIINLCADTDASVKSGMMADNTALETLMVRLTSRK